MKALKIYGIVAAAIIVVCAGGLVGYTVKNNAIANEKPPTVDELLDLVNRERTENGVPPLKIDTRLNASAQIKANDMAQYSYFSHVSPPQSSYAGKQGYTLIDTTGIECKYRSENILDNTPPDSTAYGAVQAWLKSPAHKKAMLDEKYTLTGFGINGYKIVQHFCQTR